MTVKELFASPAQENRNLYLFAFFETMGGGWVGLGGHENTLLLVAGILLAADGFSGFRISGAVGRIAFRSGDKTTD